MAHSYRSCQIIWSTTKMQFLLDVLRKSRIYCYTSPVGCHRHLLKVKLAPSEPLSAYDGMYGVVVNDREYFIVTPYNDYPYQPLLGVQKVQMCIDGWYGEHNWMLWPQVFNERLCHFACIQRSDKHSMLHALWTSISSHDFIMETAPSIIGGLGKLSGEAFLRLAGVACTILKKCAKFVTQHSNATEVKLAIDLRNGVQHLLNRLEFLTTTFCQTLITHTTLQCLCLKLVALIDYCEKYRGYSSVSRVCQGSHWCIHYQST